ncbi:hypothetical protein LUZ60_008798 [Juncus effusus]|nr:hypothetical protein LUZ60_008798 [Juncus effusus]
MTTIPTPAMDVRDLLSTAGDLDPSAPLSAPDLRLLIDRLEIHSSRLKSRARTYLLSNHRSLSLYLSQASLAAASSAEISASLSSALDLISDPPLDVEIRTLVDQIVEKRRELKEKKEAVDVVEKISGFLDRIRDVREGAREGRVLEAALSVKELKGEFFVEKKEEGEPLVFELLRKEFANCFDELQMSLARNLEECIKFDVEKRRLIVSSSCGDSKTVELSVSLQALEILDVLDYGMAKVADLIIKHVFSPVISNLSITVSQANNVDYMELILEINPSEIQEYEDGSVLYSRVIEILKFVRKYICLDKDTRMRFFAKLTWSKLSDLIISNFLSKAIPDVASKLVDFQDIIKNTSEFEDNLAKIVFISHDKKDKKLSQYVDNVELHFASKKKNEILVKARSILKEYNYTDSLSTDNIVDILFQQDKCYISKSAFQLMNLVHESLRDACLSSSRVAKEYYYAARDILFLYKAIILPKLEKQLSTISQVAIIVHNDFYYLSQEILGLAFQYRADFPSGLQKHAAFVDLAPNFYEMAENILRTQIQLIIAILDKAIDGADSFQNTHLSNQYESAKFSIEQVVFNLEKVRMMWDPILAKSTYKKAMIKIMDFVFSKITSDMLALDDIAAEETLQLQSLIHLALENMTSLFESLNNKTFDGKEKKVLNLDEIIPSLKKLRKLADLFDMSLKSITAAWEEGDLVECCFTSHEVANFINAIFADSPLRKECLLRIEDGQSS